uniref:Kinase n=1 Tax=candidate division WOR-3 bacterium TaxID=2052148 RepID=A0A7C4XK33_UNCW3
MVISRTPFRVSFFGGGTDYPIWFRENSGAVLATTIDKYCYIIARYLPPFLGYKHRIVYSQIENVNDIDEIQHPAVRECLKFSKIDAGIEIHHYADLPARTGLGSSSSFVVGLLNVLYALKGYMVTKRQLALDAIYVEQEMIKENVGNQDQILTSFGGFNHIQFYGNDDFRVTPITISAKKLEILQSSLMLFFTGITRVASEIAGEQIRMTAEKKLELKRMMEIVEEGIKILNSSESRMNEFGKLLDEAWRLKRTLTPRITTSFIDEIYEAARKKGAIGGKLLGAGGGGFILLFVEPELQNRIKETLSSLLYVPFRFETQGTQIIFYTPEETPR